MAVQPAQQVPALPPPPPSPSAVSVRSLRSGSAAGNLSLQQTNHVPRASCKMLPETLVELIHFISFKSFHL